MKKLQGMGTSPLVAIGKCIVQKRVEHVFQPEAANISNQELDRFHLARNRAEAELSELIEEL
ncbi:MAG: hypothetical protein JXR38_00310, partial [Bacilli bacterium]|nr:hypothetical protein [Bacilli bacterium]